LYARASRWALLKAGKLIDDGRTVLLPRPDGIDRARILNLTSSSNQRIEPIQRDVAVGSQVAVHQDLESDACCSSSAIRSMWSRMARAAPSPSPLRKAATTASCPLMDRTGRPFCFSVSLRDSTRRSFRVAMMLTTTRILLGNHAHGDHQGRAGQTVDRRAGDGDGRGRAGAPSH